MLSSGVKANNKIDVIPASWNLGRIIKICINTQEGTHNVSQTYLNILQDLSVQQQQVFQGKDWEILWLKLGDARWQHISWAVDMPRLASIVIDKALGKVFTKGLLSAIGHKLHHPLDVTCPASNIHIV